MKSLKLEEFLTLRNSMGISKKGQGLSLNVIVIAAIALIVLVVLVAVFTGRMGEWTAGIKKTENKYCQDVPPDTIGSSIGGIRKLSSEGCTGNEIQVYGVFEDIQVGRICCVPK